MTSLIDQALDYGSHERNDCRMLIHLMVISCFSIILVINLARIVSGHRVVGNRRIDIKTLVDWYTKLETISLLPP